MTRVDVPAVSRLVGRDRGEHPWPGPPPPSCGFVPSSALWPSGRSSGAPLPGQPPGRQLAGAGRDMVGWWFALALAGDAAGGLELGRRAFGWAPGGDGAATDPEALRAYLALARADWVRHRDAPRLVLTSEERAVADQCAARARDALLARVVPLGAARRAEVDLEVHAGGPDGTGGSTGRAGG